MTAIKVTEVSADMLLNMDKASVERTKNAIRKTAKHLKKELGEIGDGAKDSLKDLTAASGALGSVIGGALKGLAEAGPLGLVVGGLAASLGAVGVEAEHMNKQFESGIAILTTLKAKAKGLGITLQDYQRLQYLSGISGVDVGSVERIMTRLNLHAGEIQTTGANTNDATRFLSQVWGGDGSNLAGDQKLNAFMKGLKELVGEGKKDEAIKLINDVAPIAARDPATQNFLLGEGLKNWSEARSFKEVTSKAHESQLDTKENKKAYYGNLIERESKELNRLANNIDNFRKNYQNTNEIEEILKDNLAAGSGLIEAATKTAEIALKEGEDIVKISKEINNGKLVKALNDVTIVFTDPDFWKKAGKDFKSAWDNPTAYNAKRHPSTNYFPNNANTPSLK